MEDMNKKAIENGVHFLTLGDGDFSYSLDLAQYLSSYAGKNGVAKEAIVLTATSFDSIDQVRMKYNDFEFISSKLSALSKNAPTTCSDSIKKKINTISVSVHHNINAIISESGEGFDKSLSKHQFDHVIFNHPHIGTENASLHNQFLSHFFHSCYHYWLKPCGVLHLTLVKQQCRRWLCLESANKQGFILLNCVDFIPPPTSLFDGDDNIVALSYYQHRRHQSGKSFASRTEGSEVLTFGRMIDQSNFISNCLPWYETTGTTTNTTHASNNGKSKGYSKKVLDGHLFRCNQCSKTFREERSLKNHVQNVHTTNSQQSNGSSHKDIFSCDICVPSKIFKTKQAMSDHKLSKHFGQFTDIKPDWCSKVKDVTKSNENLSFGCCPICLQTYTSVREKEDHLLIFVPSATDGNNILECNICSKKFREKRALLQHSNYCNFNHSVSHAN